MSFVHSFDESGFLHPYTESNTGSHFNKVNFPKRLIVEQQKNFL